MSVMVVTGASSGIGRALAVRAARAGYDLVAVGRSTVALEELAARVRGEGARIETLAVDVAGPGAARAIVDCAERTFGRIDVLVNNAGHVAAGPLTAQSDAALQAQFGTHVIGPVALVREALPLLRASGGIVFMLGSGVARVPVGGLGAYAPSKAAVRSATSILRRELRADGVAVTYVDPGAVDTAFMTRAGMPGAPASILTSPEDVARKILLAVTRRPRVLNAVPWQTALVALAEFFPLLTDFALERAPSLVGTQNVTPAQLPAVAEAATPAIAETPSASPAAASDFDAALEPLRRRMERVKLSESFVRGLLVEGATLDPGEVAMRWAGMPNKNERAATTEVLDALAEHGFVAAGNDGYRVLRAP